MAKETKKGNVKQPTKEEEILYNEIVSDTPSYAMVRGKKWGMRFLKNGTKRKITELMLSNLSEDNAEDKKLSNLSYEDKVVCKSAAILRLNGLWKIKFFYWIVWRWFYYIKQYTDTELLPYLVLSKKKMGAESYLIAITLLTALKDTKMMMTRTEVEHIQAEQIGVQHGHSQKNSTESPNQEISSGSSK